MVIKDEISSWFLRNVVIPALEIIDRPGFIVMKPFIRGSVYSRQILMPESFLINLENRISEKYGDKGKQVLYSIGKKFGCRFSIMIGFPRMNECRKKELLTVTYFIARFVGCTYAHKISREVNFRSNELSLTMDDFIVCRKNGCGHIFTEGGISGIWAYLLSNSSVEGTQPKCQGRGDKMCETICAPPEVLEKKGLKFFRETDLDSLDMDMMYEDMNKIRETEYTQNSFEDMVNFKFFDYSRGVVKHKDERYFLCEASLIYLLEMGLKKLEGATEILFECAFEHGMRIAKLQGKCDCQEFIMQFLSSSGWGDVLMLESKGKYGVTSYYFPWTKFAGEVNFEMYRGLVSGLLSGCLDKRIMLNKVNVDTLGEGLTVSLS